VKPQVAPPSPDHIEFDLLCLGIDEFEPLPSLTGQHSELVPDRVEESALDGQILAGLVTP
jgi:hypothetical protein